MLPHVCAVCGVSTGRARSGRWIHVDDLPEGSKPHEVVAVDRAAYQVAQVSEVRETPLIHAKAWAQALEARMGREEYAGLKWSDEVKHGVVLYQALEAAEVKVRRLQADLELLAAGGRGE